MRKVSSGKISVIIPVHNAEKYIAKAVQSNKVIQTGNYF